MSSIGTFGAFTTARLGIYAAHLGLNVTGNNIANINTYGYTRQTLDQVSLRAGAGDRYQSTMTVRVGSGVLATGVSQIRDPYLDIRYRTEAASVGSMNSKLSGLNDLAAILDEVADGDEQNGLIEAQLSALRTALQNLTTSTGQEEFDTQVKSSVEALVTLFNSYASRLEQLKENTVDSFQENVDKVNELLANIGELNAQIRKSDIHGDNALEMRDERNRLIDELSQYVKIDVVYSTEDLGGGFEVEKLTIKLGNANPDSKVTTDSSTLVDGAYYTQLGVTQIPKPNPDYDPNQAISDTNKPYLMPDGTPTIIAEKAEQIDDPNYRISLSALRDSKGQLDPNAALQHIVVLDDNDLYGALQSVREMLTESGEFASDDMLAMDENAAIKRGIPYYQKSLDLLANKIATVFNEANQGYMVNEKGNYIDEDGNEIKMPDGTILNKNDTLTADQKAELEKNGQKVGGNLFSNSGDGDDATGITAANISVSHKWSTGEVHIVSSYVRPTGMDGPASTDNSNILHMVSLMDQKMDYNPQDLDADATSDRLFNGTFQEMLTNINSVLGNDTRSTNVMLNTYYNATVELDTSRSSVAGVDLNDEAASLMQYQKSYSAACRLMTTLDQALDKLINGTGTVGL